MNYDYEKIRRKLYSLAEPEYREFSSALVPGVENMIGVRIPDIRKIAKGIAKENPIDFFNNCSDDTFEEILLQGLVICEMKGDIEDILKRVEVYVPKINNWSLCDSFSMGMKTFRKNKELVWNFLALYWQSDKPYYIRFAVVSMLAHYVERDYLQKMFGIFDFIQNEDYYVKMSVAWAISVCFVKFPKETMEYLKTGSLDDETFNKSLQKIRESLRVSKEDKEIIKGMKR